MSLGGQGQVRISLVRAACALVVSARYPRKRWNLDVKYLISPACSSCLLACLGLSFTPLHSRDTKHSQRRLRAVHARHAKGLRYKACRSSAGPCRGGLCAREGERRGGDCGGDLEAQGGAHRITRFPSHPSHFDGQKELEVVETVMMMMMQPPIERAIADRGSKTTQGTQTCAREGRQRGARFPFQSIPCSFPVFAQF